MTRTCSSFVAVLIGVVAATAQAQPAAPAAAQARSVNLRHQIYLMEGALARAVNFGAASLNQEIRAVMPDMLVLAGESTARGFHLDGYGVFFDVEVPVLRQRREERFGLRRRFPRKAGHQSWIGFARGQLPGDSGRSEQR